MATAVEESASPPPSTIEAGPLQPVTAITVYATTASVAHHLHACDRPLGDSGSHADASRKCPGACQCTGMRTPSAWAHSAALASLEITRGIAYCHRAVQRHQVRLGKS